MSKPENITNGQSLPMTAFDIQQFNAGERLAFKMIYDRLGKWLLNLTEQMIPTEDLHSREKMVADVFIDLFYARETLHSYQEIRRFCFHTMEGKIIADFQTRKKKDQKATEGLSIMATVFSKKLQDAVLQVSLLQHLSDRLAELPAKTARVISLSVFHNKTDQEIALELAITAEEVIFHKRAGIDGLKDTILTDRWLTSNVTV